MKKKRTLRPKYGIMISAPDKDLDKVVTQYLRLVVAEAPDAVRVAAIEAVKESSTRPVSINNCHIEIA